MEIKTDINSRNQNYFDSFIFRFCTVMRYSVRTKSCSYKFALNCKLVEVKANFKEVYK